MAGKDQFNDLPDSLLVLILKKVPFKQVVRCSVLSKRWKLLWTFLPYLKFDEDFFHPPLNPPEFEDIIGNILQLHSVPLEVFEFHNIPCLKSDKIYEWTLHANFKDLREMSIEGCHCHLCNKLEVPTSLFSFHNLRSLNIKYFRLTNAPASFGGFPYLATLCLHGVNLNDKTFELMVESCQVLENLTMRECQGLQTMKIHSLSLNSLHLDFLPSPTTMTANCPLLVSMKIKRCCPMTHMYLELPACLHFSTISYYPVLKQFTTVKSLTKITFLKNIDGSDIRLLREFPNLEELCINYGLPRCPKHVSQMTVALEHLKQVHVNITSFLGDSMPLFSYFLQNAPALKRLIVSRRKGFHGIRALRFVNQLLNLPRSHVETKILLTRKDFREVKCLNCDLEDE